MGTPVRSTFDLCLSGVSVLLGIALDAALLSIFKTHLQQVFGIPRYRPVYLRSGRRNRNRH
jgi:hypothetical protein